MAVSDRTDSATPCAVHGRPARIAEGRISTFPRFLTLKLLPFSAPPGGIYLIFGNAEFFSKWKSAPVLTFYRYRLDGHEAGVPPPYRLRGRFFLWTCVSMGEEDRHGNVSTYLLLVPG